MNQPTIAHPQVHRTVTAMAMSRAELSSRIVEVRYAPTCIAHGHDHEVIDFYFDSTPWRGHLRGDYRGYKVTNDRAANASLGLLLILDKQAQPLVVGSSGASHPSEVH